MSERSPDPDFEPLPRDVVDYVAAFREVEQPNGHAVDAAWAAIEAETAAAGSDTKAGAPTPEQETGERRRGAAWMIGAGLAIAAALLLMVLGPRLLSTDEPDRAPSQAPFAGDGGDSEGWARAAARDRDPRPAVEGKRVSPGVNEGHAAEQKVDEAPEAMLEDSPEQPPGVDEASAEGVDAPAAAPAEGAEEPGKARRSPRPRKEPVAAPTPDAPPPNPLREEAALFGKAKLALVEGDAQRALALLNEHATKFPGGALGLEAKVVRAQALCKLGRKAQAQKLRDRFVERHSGTTLAARMDDICR